MNKRQQAISAKADPVDVFCRVRPMNDSDESTSCLRILDDSTLMLTIPECSSAYRSGQIKQLVYSFAQVFNESTTQSEIYENVAKPLVRDVLNGKNGLLFTYGVTGSGKTFSMMGNNSEYGILQRSLESLFQSIGSYQAKKYIFKPDRSNGFEIQSEADASLDRQREMQSRNYKRQQQATTNIITQPVTQSPLSANADNIYSVFLSCVEIYNNYFYDLMDDQSNANNAAPMSDMRDSKMLKEDSRGNMYIKDMNEIEVKSLEEALEAINRAQKRRVIASTDLNAESSRSHSIFTARVVQASRVQVENISGSGSTSRSIPMCVSQLSLVDLAGSERTKRTKNTGSRLREAGSINSSLMQLRNCMEALRENCVNGTRKMVPYRDTKLTLLFKNYFEGNGRIKMILCINPSSIEFDETLNVMKFSELVRDVLVPVENESKSKIPKSCSYNANLANQMGCEDFDSINFSILKTLQKNNFQLMDDPFPSVDIMTPEDEVTIPRLIEYLEEFQRRREALVHDMDLIKQHMRAKFRDINEELDRMRQERDDYKSRMANKDREFLKSESKIKALEKVINMSAAAKSTSTSSSSGVVVQSSTSSISTSSYKQSSQHSTASIVTNQAVNGSSSSTSNETNFSAVNSRVNRLITENRGVGGNNNATSTSHGSSTPSSGQSSRTVGSITNNAAFNRFQATPQRGSNIAAMNNSNIRGEIQRDGGIPVANRRQQRRSKSVEMWIDHKPPTTPKIDTVMQPKMNRKKSVSKLELKDAKHASKYVLTHLEQDERGEIQANLVKGNILRSPSGGANVIFTETETLRIMQQEQPKPVKRSNDQSLLQDTNLISERCSFGIEGHPIKPKMIKS